MKNSKGQAFVETLVLASLVLLLSLKLIQLGLDLRYDILFDELTEQTLLCNFQKRSDCQSKLRRNLEDLRFKNIQVSNRLDGNTANLKIIATTQLNAIFTRESSLTLDLSAP